MYTQYHATGTLYSYVFLQAVPFQIKYASSQHPKLIFQKDQQEYIFIGTKILSKNKNPHGE